MIDIDVYKIGLPPPSQELLDLAKQVIFNQVTPYKDEACAWFDEFHQANTITATHFFSYKTESLALTKKIQEEYSKYFPGITISSYFGLMQGDYAETGKLKCHPPHVDVVRNVNINYFIELGGDDVQTWFYDYRSPRVRNRDNVLENYRKKADLKPLGYCKFEPGWVTFDSVQCHSIENVKSNRYFVAIMMLKDSVTRDVNGELNGVFIDPTHDGQTDMTVKDVVKMFDRQGISTEKIELTPICLQEH